MWLCSASARTHRHSTSDVGVIGGGSWLGCIDVFISRSLGAVTVEVEVQAEECRIKGVKKVGS